MELSMRFLFSTIIFLSLTVPLKAQERGRLSNGAAYRTDRDGNQIVDYIAELEVENDALRRRIGGLEGEVESLMGSGSSVNSRNSAPKPQMLQEKDLGVASASNTCPLLTCGENECETFIYEIESRHQAVLEKQLDQFRELKAENESCYREFEAFKASIDSSENGDQRVDMRLASEINLTKELRRKLAASEQEKEQLRTIEANLRQANLDLKRQLKLGRSPVKTAVLKAKREPRASVNEEIFTPQVSSVVNQVSADQRSALSARLKNIISLRNKRDKMFKGYSSTSVRVQKQPIMTQKGKTPDQLLKEVSGITNLRTLRSYEKDTAKLLSRVKADIALMQRLKS